MTQQRTGASWRAGFSERWRDRDRLIIWIEWGLFFAGLLLSVWLATQSSAAPQLILLALLTIISINFSIPLENSIISPTLPIVAVSSLLILDWPMALVVMGASFLLADFARPLWMPLWNNTPLSSLPRRDRFGRAVIHLLSLALAGLAYQRAGGVAPLSPDSATLDALTVSLAPLVILSLAFAASYTILTLLYWSARQRREGRSLSPTLVYFPIAALFTQPFALFGAITFASVGLPGFVIFCVGVGAFAVIIWVSWQRQFVLQQQLTQFATLNNVGVLLRESLDLGTVLAHTYEQVNRLLPSDHFTIMLIDDDGRWTQPLNIRDGQDAIGNGLSQTFLPDVAPNDFVAWVVEHRRVLNVNQENVHFARQHNLSLPEPRPSAWLGVPLITANKVRGSMVLERFDSSQPFSEWGQEVLLAFAGQVSAAIQNAQLYSEVVRLYNLTDEALAERVQQLQALLDSTHEGVLMFDTDARIVLVNPVAARLVGKERQALLHNPLDSAGAAGALGYRAEELSALLRQLSRGTPPEARSHTFESRQPDSDNGGGSVRRFIERNEGPVLANDTHVMGWLLVLRDVTEEVERAEWRLNATRMIVHDLRNPITTISSTVDLIENRLGEEPNLQLAELTESARRGCDEMLDMVDSLMDMTRMEAGQLVVDAEAMHLAPLLERVAGYMRPLALQKRITVRTESSSELPAVWGDAEILRRVFMNLLDNALKFTPAGGQVFIRLITDLSAGEDANAGALCIIEDTGPGISEADKARIFDRFVRINVGGAQLRGTGLGLSFCKMAIEAHGGRIWAEDTGEGGSCFKFTVPGIPLF